MEEAELRRKILENEMNAFSELVEEFSPRVINTCYRFFPGREDAEDISQEVFIEIFKSIKSFRGDSKLSTWIYRVTISKCLDEIKKRKRKKRFASFGKMLHIDDIASRIGGGSMPDKSIQEKDSFKEIMTALETLSDNQRVAFTLSKIEGYSNGEIADILNTTLTAVESLISHAKKKVKKELERILKNDD